MLRAVLRACFPVSHLAVLTACGVEELGSHLSACLDCSSAFGGIAELYPFLPLSTAAGPAAGASPGRQHLTSTRKEHVQPVEGDEVSLLAVSTLLLKTEFWR